MEMVSICWQCGDIGYKDVLVYCTRCKIAPRHSYCLDELSDGITAKINWICEDCKIKSPNSTNKAKFFESSSKSGHGSGRSAIGMNDSCQGIGFVDDHLVDPQDQLSISNLRIDSNLNMNKNISYDIKNGSLSCRTGGAPGTVSSSFCFKLNEVGIEESGNEKSEGISSILQNKNRLDKSQTLVGARSTDNHFAAKMLTDNSVETSNMQTSERMPTSEQMPTSEWMPTSEQMPNFDMSDLGAGRLSPFFALNKDGIHEFCNWKIKGRRSKRRLILPSKDKLDSFNPLIDGKDANISLAVKRIPGTVSPSCFKLNENGMGECGNDKPEIKSLILPDMDKLDKSISLVDLQTTEPATKRISVTSVDASDIQITKRTSDFGVGGLDAGRLSSFFGLKEGEIEESEKLKSRRLVLPSKEELDTQNSLGSGKGTNNSFVVKRISGTEQLGREITGRTMCCTNHTNGAVRSSSLCKQKDYKIEKNGKINLKDEKLFQPIKEECYNFYPLIDGQNTNISHTVKKFTVSSVEPSDRPAMGRILNSNANTPSEVKPAACFRRLIPPAKEPFDDKTLNSNSSCGANAHATVRSSTCFELKRGQVEEQGKEKPMIRRLITAGVNVADAIHLPIEAKIDRNGKEKLESERLILDTNDHLNHLQVVTNRQGASINLADKSLHATSVAASDRRIIGRTEVKTQTKFPCQQTSHSMPVVSHVWSGTFNINKGEFGPFIAHLSNKACEKVCNLARKLPLVLHMQKLPRLAAWPNSFKVSSPTDDNIALYFSPESHRVEIVLDGLVDDIINNDLMLKCHFDEVELLVFSSFLLPREHQRLYGKYYAWGVFKPISAQPCSVSAGSHAVPNGVAEGNQVDSSLKPAIRNEVDHTDILLKNSAQEIIEYNLCLSIVQTKEGTVMVTTDSTPAYDEEKRGADNCAPSVCEVEGLGNRPLKETSQEFCDFQSGGEIARVTSDSLDTCDKEKFRAKCRIPSACVEYSGNIEKLRDCEKKLSHVNHGRSSSKSFTFELKEVAEEGIERVDMVSSRVRSNVFRGCIEHQLDGNMLQYTEEKLNSADSSISRKRHNNNSCGLEEGEISDFDNSSVSNPSIEQPITNLVTEQQSVMEQSTEVDQLGEQILGFEMSIELPKLLPGTEEGEVCDDECFDDSRNCESTCLDLFPLQMENMGIAVRLTATQEIAS